ncbi:MAG: hypothetical protein JXB39_01135 [Deltaproteobacteria bacterium]|nr:hypothetical protein [Deltaproteobacteria bacterium]
MPHLAPSYLLVVGLLGPVRAADFPLGGGTTDPVFHGRIPPGTFVAVRLDLETGEATVVESAQRPIGDTARRAVERAPAWVRERLADRFSRLSQDQEVAMAECLLEVEDSRIVDEVAFAIASVSIDHLEDVDFDVETLVRNAQGLYEADPWLPYVELVDVGQADLDDDYHTTTRYRMLDPHGSPVAYEVPPDIYYWYVAMPTFESESLTMFDPVADEPALVSEGGVFWRDFYLYQDPSDPSRCASTHFGTEFPTLLEDAMVSGWGPSAQGVLVDFEIDPIGLVVDPESGAPTLAIFSYPTDGYYDASVVATTMPLELGYRTGHGELLENVLSLGNASASLPTTRRIAILKDRDPWGQPTVEEALAALGFGRVDVYRSDQIAEMLNGKYDYRKIIVPSAQPRALYEALASARAEIDAWCVRDPYAEESVWEFHGAIDPEHPEDTWCDLDVPGGFSCALTEQGIDDLAVEGYPEFLDVVPLADHVLQWSDEQQTWHGWRPLDPTSSAVDLIGYWATQNHQDRCSELPGYYRGPDGDDVGSNLDQTLRSPYPQRTLYLHFGNCGESQDLLGAALRAGLIPNSDVGTFIDDHVWNLAYIDGEWLTCEIRNSDGHTIIGGRYQCGRKSTVLEFRGDGRITDRTAFYSDNDTATLEFDVTDALGRPVDGAEVVLATWGRYSPDTLLVGFLGWTDLDGHLSADVQIGHDWYGMVVAPAGVWPGPDAQTVALVVSDDQCDQDGEVFTEDVELDDTIPVEPWAFEVRAGEGGIPVRVSLACFLHALEADNWIYGRRFTEFYDGGEVDVVLLDEENYALLTEGHPFVALEQWAGVETLEETLSLAPGYGAVHLVVSNLGRYAHSAFVDLDLTADLPEPETGGCGCGAAGSGRAGAAWIGLAALVLALRRKVGPTRRGSRDAWPAIRDRHPGQSSPG